MTDTKVLSCERHKSIHKALWLGCGRSEGESVLALFVVGCIVLIRDGELLRRIYSAMKGLSIHRGSLSEEAMRTWCIR